MSGAKNSGIVSFTVLSQHRTRISLRLSYSSEGIAESAQRMLGVIMVRVVNDLRHFKEFIERRNAPTIAWRQRIPKSIHVG
jgi:uncharacterized membrane protein